MYTFYLGDIQLPQTPESLSVKVNNQNTTVVLMNDSEVNILKQAGLDDYSFDIPLPHTAYPFVNADVLKSIDYYLSAFKQYKAEKKVLDFIITRTLPNGTVHFNTSVKVSIEDYEVSESAENGLDMVVSINLKEYKSFSTKVLSVSSTNDGNKTITEEKKRETTKTTPKTYKVKKGDTLWAICKKEFGDGTKYKDIAKLNGITNPNFIKVGQVIKLS